ncbi:type II toxin-antitoxin system VapC family toxin [Herbidospora mongoliensis]|uniref:type II toxin-antitoxin system VapC family toxin n=1 Tax=Herbidospora mongoliensis TaxID=688067 RepID=UPI0008296DF6|nr:PIN domain-containing protein [Herbidospora mongoliensis]
MCDSGPLIATFDPGDRFHVRCTRLLLTWPGRLVIPEPVLGETCNFLRNNVRKGAELEAARLEAVTSHEGDFVIADPTPADRRRASDLVRRLVNAPMGYVDATVLAMAERLSITDVATTDAKFVGLAHGVSRITPLAWPFQENND